MAINYEPIFDAEGIRIPRYALQGLGAGGGMGAMGQVAGDNLQALLTALSKRAREVGDLVRGLGQMIEFGEASQADVDRVKGHVIGFSREVGRLMPLIPDAKKPAIQDARKTLLAGFTRIENTWRTQKLEAKSTAMQIRTLMGIMANDLANAATIVGAAVAKAAKEVAEQAVPVAAAAGGAIREIGKGVTSGFGGIIIPLGIAAIVVAAVVGKAYLPAPPRRNRCRNG